MKALPLSAVMTEVRSETLEQSKLLTIGGNNETLAGRVWAAALADPLFAAAFADGQADLVSGRVVDVPPEDL